MSGSQEQPTHTNPTGETPPAAGGQVPEQLQTFSLEYVQKLRQEAAANRTQNKELSGRLAELEKAQMTDLERAQNAAQLAQKEAEAAKEAAKLAAAKSEITRLAAQHNLPIDVALKFVKPEFGPDGQLTGVEESVKELAAMRGTQSQAAGPSGGTNPPRPKEAPLTEKDLRGKSPEWIMQNWDKVEAAYKQK